MKLKVCGLKHPNNFLMIHDQQPDMMGFIFVPSSSRFVDERVRTVHAISRLKCDKVGVFVNAELSTILATMKMYDLNYVQLHGDESPEVVSLLAKQFKVIKAFQIDEEFDFDLEKYNDASYFLFDAKGPHRGGNGIKFEWSLLSKYKGNVSFFLSGGIRLEDIDDILKITHPKLAGIDVNSGFESYPGFKNVELISQLKTRIDEVYS